MGTKARSEFAAQPRIDADDRIHRAFSLLEVLVVLGIIALLLALMLPALSKARRAGRNLKCVANMRQVAERFIVFADDFAVESRGSAFPTTRSTFYLETFQESLYGINDFWNSQNALPQQIDPANQPLMCPEGPYVLKRKANAACSDGAIFPKMNVSIAFNRRLHRPTAGSFQKLLSGRVLGNPDVPLAMDADAAAPNAPSDPYYAAPPLATNDGYENGEHWIPSTRHEGRMNVAFIGGHVGTSRHPLSAPGWHWGYVPE
ncbi:MAG: prepilin-type N-terminal cleavage/methylation domain-containing protein [Phycisphaerales bacterium]|nr:prepilin-type N-terminal cleavage/methylation domain-containing protein [Phycisphaerales bacterium]MCB9856449.1 prepilin-type N-terminal cleavage/methylation domain-containing protein [Phycisphaerales bacterium]